MLYATEVSTIRELEQILQLQQQNLIANISAKEKEEQGFVTMPFTLSILQAMHRLAPSVLVKEDEQIAGYAIVFLKEGRPLYPNLEPMFQNFEKLTWQGNPLNQYNFYIMGQICVGKEFRGKGVFDLLYDKHRELYKDRFDFIITEISTSNHRSIRAHERVGFKTISVHKDHLDEWAVVLWDWKNPSH